MSSVVRTLCSICDRPALGLGPLGGMVTRQPLGRGAWVDLLPGWLGGAGERCSMTLLSTCRGRPSDGRCTTGWSTSRACSASTARTIRCLTRSGDGPRGPERPLRTELGEPFTTAGLCLYRDGRDSVAWHGDTIGRGKYRGHHGGDRLPRIGARRSCCGRAAAGRPSGTRWVTAI